MRFNNYLGGNNMRNLSNSDIITFIQAVRDAEGGVWFVTNAGDRLDLKSLLNQYIFIAAANDPDNSYLPNGRLICDNEDDRTLFVDFQ